VTKGKNDSNLKLDLSSISNLVPGTLVYNGKKPDTFKIELYSYNEKKYELKTFKTVEDFIQYYKKHLKSSNQTVWMNVTGINHISEIQKIGDYFDISDFVLEQIVNITKHSSFKSEANYIFNDLQMVYLKDNEIEIENFSIFNNEDIVITFQERDGDVFDAIRDRIKTKQGYIRNKKSAYLYYCLLDVLVDNYLNVLDVIRQEVELAEASIINEEDISIKEIHKLRKYIMMFKLNCTPIDHVVKYFSKNESLLELDDKQFMDILQEHTTLLTDEVMQLKELVNVLFENYMLNNGNEMNKVMTTLTIFSAIFIPLSFLAGVFGMNFKHMPGMDSPFGFYYFIAGCLLTAVFMIGFFKVKKWF